MKRKGYEVRLLLAAVAIVALGQHRSAIASNFTYTEIFSSSAPIDGVGPFPFQVSADVSALNEENFQPPSWVRGSLPSLSTTLEQQILNIDSKSSDPGDVSFETNKRGDVAFWLSNLGYFLIKNNSIIPVLTTKLYDPSSSYDYVGGPAGYALDQQGNLLVTAENDVQVGPYGPYGSYDLYTFTNQLKSLGTYGLGGSRCVDQNNEICYLGFANDRVLITTGDLQYNALLTLDGEKVVSTGDILFGKTVKFIYTAPDDSLDDRGVVNFSLGFTDGSIAIVQASSIPEPDVGNVLLYSTLASIGAIRLSRRSHERKHGV